MTIFGGDFVNYHIKVDMPTPNFPFCEGVIIVCRVSQRKRIAMSVITPFSTHVGRQKTGRAGCECWVDKRRDQLSSPKPSEENNEDGAVTICFRTFLDYLISRYIHGFQFYPLSASPQASREE